MITKDQYHCWERFVLSLKQGKSAAVQSEERREAILAIADRFNTIYQANIDGAAVVGSKLVIGNAGITPMMAEAGYIGTICAEVDGGDRGCESVVQDLHVTKKQLEDLRDGIDFFLKTIAKHVEK